MLKIKTLGKHATQEPTNTPNRAFYLNIEYFSRNCVIKRTDLWENSWRPAAQVEFSSSSFLLKYSPKTKKVVLL